MTKLDMRFNELKENNKKALITYITAGDPTLEITKQLVLEMERKGADIIELGIPFSDPIADGPVIQRAAQRSLSQKIKINNIMDTVRQLRKETKVPIVYLLYFNCMLQYGIEKFLGECAEVGVDGLVIPDLSYEEGEDIRKMAAQYEVHIIPLIAPTSSGRIKMISSEAKGFIYCISSTGVTGTRNEFKTDLSRFIETIAQYSDIPKAIGFGVSTAEQVKHLGSLCDGVIVGSAIVKIIEEYNQSPELVLRVGQFVGELKEAL